MDLVAIQALRAIPVIPGRVVIQDSAGRLDIRDSAGSRAFQEMRQVTLGSQVGPVIIPAPVVTRATVEFQGSAGTQELQVTAGIPALDLVEPPAIADTRGLQASRVRVVGLV